VPVSKDCAHDSQRSAADECGATRGQHGTRTGNQAHRRWELGAKSWELGAGKEASNTEAAGSNKQAATSRKPKAGSNKQTARSYTPARFMQLFLCFMLPSLLYTCVSYCLLFRHTLEHLRAKWGFFNVGYGQASDLTCQERPRAATADAWLCLHTHSAFAATPASSLYRLYIRAKELCGNSRNRTRDSDAGLRKVMSAETRCINGLCIGPVRQSWPGAQGQGR